MKTQWRAKIGSTEFRIMRMQDAPLDTTTMDCPESLVAWAEPLLRSSARFSPDQECFAVIYLTTRHNPIGIEIVTIGLLDQVMIHPREVFRSAIVVGAHAVCLMHNHPSGDPSPSGPDITETKKLIKAGELIRIEVIDHIIIGQPSPARIKHWVSLKEQGYFSK